MKRDSDIHGRAVPIVWNGRRTTAWIPGLLRDRDFSLSTATERAIERATTMSRTTSADAPAQWEALARLILRSEGAASSAIEGVHAGYTEIVLAQRHHYAPAAHTWVRDNLIALDAALDHAGGVTALTIDDLHQWHRLLMVSSPLPPSMIGAVRDEQGWIGGTSPFDAAFVPPPPDVLGVLMNDLLAYCNAPTSFDDGVKRAAIVHAQFETIHPYGDGNGRLGRILLLWLIVRELRLTYPPALSVRLERNRGAYLSGLTLFQQGSHDHWVRTCADMLTDATNDTRRIVRELSVLRETWNAATLGLRSDSAAIAAIDLIPKWVVLDANLVAEQLGVSTRAARAALRELLDRRVVETMTFATLPQPGRPSAQYASAELLRILAR